MFKEKITLKIGEIIPYEKNPRKKKTIENVKQSIKECGYLQDILVDENNIILAGHSRLQALKSLKYKDVDVVKVTGLDEPTKVKYRILDNKTNEDSIWDSKLLAFEIADFDLDFSEFEFDFNKMLEEKPGDYKQTKNLDNFFKADFETLNDWGIPEIEPCNIDLTGCEFVSFGEKSKIIDPSNTIIHFYIDDYKFESVWSSPDKWLELFKSCKAIITPDFSNYTDMPKAQQLWNHYRRQWCGKYWQDNGVNVIPSLSWANEQIYDWNFAGVPQETICATSFVGDNIDKQASIDELLKVLDIVKPLKLFIKANKTDEEELKKWCDFVVIPAYSFKG